MMSRDESSSRDFLFLSHTCPPRPNTVPAPCWRPTHYVLTRSVRQRLLDRAHRAGSYKRAKAWARSASIEHRPGRTRLVSHPSIGTCNATGPRACPRCIDRAPRPSLRLLSVQRQLENSGTVRTRTGQSETVHFSVSRASRGLSAVAPAGRPGVLEVRQRSWRKWIRAPVGRPAWAVAVASALVPEANEARLPFAAAAVTRFPTHATPRAPLH